jgi:leader peptidase (prepilin peptidase)/N-methyltransferase
MPDISLIVMGAGVLGLVIGSFLNVVIHRYPKMLEQQWAAEVASYQGQEAPQGPTYNLMKPRSACPHCGHQIRWYENIPVLSFLVLRAKCASCGTGISWRYPLIELATAGLFAWCVWRWGLTPSAGVWAVFSAMLLTMAAIDWDTTLLPDDLTLPLVWLGLCASALGWIQLPLEQALWGAVVGYMSLWSIYWLFKLATGKEGMGYGDFKLFAALGAWLGWQALPAVILMAAMIGSVVGIAMKFNQSLREGRYVPFGPFLALGGFTALAVGADRMLEWVGF